MATATPTDQESIDAANRGRQIAARARNCEMDCCVRKFFAQRRDHRHGQNQIANALKLDEQNLQRTTPVVAAASDRRQNSEKNAALIAPSSSPARKRPADARGNGPR